MNKQMQCSIDFFLLKLVWTSQELVLEMIIVRHNDETRIGLSFDEIALKIDGGALSGFKSGMIET